MRTILLADMNAFFASVTQVLEPELRGKPLLIAGDREKRRGIILAASYEAKKRGVKTGMAIWEALLYCPEAILRAPNYPAYLDFSARILNILRDFSPLVEPFSIDEAFVDLTGTEPLLGPPLQVAKKIKERLGEEVGVLCSIGIGPSKVTAKMAAELEKPDGLTILTDADIPARLWPLPIGDLYGVGPRLEKHLQNMGFRTIGDLAQSPLDLVARRFGAIGVRLHQFANGCDDSPVDPRSLQRLKSIGHQITLPRDYQSPEDIDVVLLELAEAVCRRARLGNYAGRTVSLYVRGNDFSGLTRSRSFKKPTASPQAVFDQARRLFRQHWPAEKPVRLLGVALGNLIQPKERQLSLFDAEEKLYEAVDSVKDRFGETSLLRGSFLLEAGVFYSGGRLQETGRPPRFLI